MEEDFNNNKPGKELPIERTDRRIDKDYKEVMNEATESREDRMRRYEENIRDLPAGKWEEVKIKAIASMLFFGLNIEFVCRVMGMSKSSIYRVPTEKAPPE